MLSRVESPLPPQTDEIIHQVIRCAIAVHSTLGPGYLEAVYHRALKLELTAQSVMCETEHAVHVRYRDQLLCLAPSVPPSACDNFLHVLLCSLPRLL